MAIETGCKKCGSEDYQLLDARTGEVLCSYCRNRWVEPLFIQKTETERFLEEQAKRPQVILDNTTETDQQLMDMVSKAAGVATGGCVNRVARLIIVVVAVIILLTVLSFFGIFWFFK